MVAELVADDGLVLDIRNRIGSVEHYYHFLLGFLAPLALKLGERAERAGQRPVAVRSCGPFDGLLREIFGDQIRILPKHEHARLLQDAKAGGSKISCETLRGFDNRRFYSLPAFRALRENLTGILSSELEQERAVLADFRSSPIKIAFIDRGNPDPFYSTANAERSTSGNVRRSIENYSDCVDFLTSQGLPVRPYLLEGKSLAFQMVLFDSADIIIAQHGAALTNLIWASAKTAVIEIIPRDGEKERDHFRTLAKCLGQKYCAIYQDHSHSAVDPHVLYSRIMQIRRDREFQESTDVSVLARLKRYFGILH
jgi:hypothetical protein